MYSFCNYILILKNKIIPPKKDLFSKNKILGKSLRKSTKFIHSIIRSRMIAISCVPSFEISIPLQFI